MAKRNGKLIRTNGNLVFKNGSEIRTDLTPSVELMILDVAKMIAEGKSRQTCIQYVQEVRGVCLDQAKNYYESAVNYLLPRDEESYRTKLLAINVARLERIIEKGMTDDRDLRLAKDAIAEMNKMLLPTQKGITQVKQADGSEIITINFD